MIAISLRLRAIDLAVIDAAAKAAGVTRSRYLRESSLAMCARGGVTRDDSRMGDVARDGLRAALLDISDRWPDDDEHARGHDPETCPVVICVAKRALRALRACYDCGQATE